MESLRNETRIIEINIQYSDIEGGKKGSMKGSNCVVLTCKPSMLC